MSITAEYLYNLLLKYETDDLIEIRNYPDLKERIEADIEAIILDRAPAMLALLEKALPIIEAEAKMRECGIHSEAVSRLQRFCHGTTSPMAQGE